jgi:hypothetical protein
VTAEPERKSVEKGFDSRSEAEIRQSLWRMGGATTIKPCSMQGFFVNSKQENLNPKSFPNSQFNIQPINFNGPIFAYSYSMKSTDDKKYNLEDRLFCKSQIPSPPERGSAFRRDTKSQPNINHWPDICIILYHGNSLVLDGLYFGLTDSTLS